jgi:CRISPR-associated exonuclease Cas4
MDILLILAAVLVALAVAALWSAGRQRKAAGLPDGRVVAADTNGWKRMEKPLYDPDSGLTGRPDYVIEQDGLLIPVEVKSSWAPPEPHDSHLFQLAAYCLLIEHYSGVRPPYGILHYRNRTFEIDYTPELEGQLRSLLEEIRSQRGAVNRSHNEAARCEHCGFRATCDQKL